MFFLMHHVPQYFIEMSNRIVHSGRTGATSLNVVSLVMAAYKLGQGFA